MTATSFKVGDVVVNLGHTLAVVVGVREDGPILRSWNGKKAWGGKWVADPAKTVLSPCGGKCSYKFPHEHGNSENGEHGGR